MQISHYNRQGIASVITAMSTNTKVYITMMNLNLYLKTLIARDKNGHLAQVLHKQNKETLLL